MTAGFNVTFLNGHVGKDAQCRTSPDGNQIAFFSVATTDYFKDKAGEKKSETQWHNVVCYGKLAAIAVAHVKKGANVSLTGSLKYNKWKNAEGVEKTNTQICCTKLQVLSSPRSNEPNGNVVSDDNFGF